MRGRACAANIAGWPDKVRNFLLKTTIESPPSAANAEEFRPRADLNRPSQPYLSDLL
jgi:hypothetical protein